MSRDTLYTDQTSDEPFEFNEAVARVFPDMLQRSIPGYAETVRAIESLAARCVPPGSNCYDLGCSLGAATFAMRRAVKSPDCRIVAVDNSAAMISRCRKVLDQESTPASSPRVELVEGDIRDVTIQHASMVVLNYTLQFLPLESRSSLLERICEGMLPDGVLVLSEKVVNADERIENTLVDLHHDFKRSNAYSDLEIARKRNALENVLVPESTDTHLERLRAAGFQHTGVWLRHFNFVSLIAIR